MPNAYRTSANVTTRRRLADHLHRFSPELWGAAAGVLFGLLFLFVTSPANFLSKLVVVTGPTCGKSERLVRSIVADPALQAVFTPLSVADDDRDPVVAKACIIAYGHVFDNAPWFRLMGEDWVCARLKEEARRNLQRAHHILPVWIHDGSQLSHGERDRLLSNAGLHLLPGGDGVVFDAEVSGAVEPPAPRPTRMSEWRGQDIAY